jgi:long-chain acyl-CoA synthetase
MSADTPHPGDLPSRSNTIHPAQIGRTGGPDAARVVRWFHHLTEQTVVSQFDLVAAANARKTAILWGRETVTYAELRKRIHRYAANLQTGPEQTFGAGWNIRPGDRVGILLENSPEFIYVLYAALKSGAVVVPINNFLKAPEIQHIVDDCGLSCLVTSSDFHETVAKLHGVRTALIDDLENRLPTSEPAWPTVNRSDTALIIYTSGTTGKPKGAILSHGNIASNVHSCIQALEETDDDRLTLLLPMFHSFMLTVCIFTPLSMGAGIVLIRSLHPFKAAMREMIFNRATIFVGIPQIFQALAQANIPFWMHWVLKLRMAVSGAAPLPRETLEAFERKMHIPLLEGYGLSEASPVVSFNPYHSVRKPGSVGLPLPDIEVKIFDDHDRELPPEQVGEIVVRGPNVMQGYYNQPEETAATLRDGWLHTGDVGRKDADGYIYIVDRRKEMLLVRGMNVYPREIEEVIYQFPNVREAAVVARADEKRGEVPIAFVIPVEGAKLQPDELLRFCRERLADYKLPREIRIVESLPHTATGKIAKLALKKQL